MGLTPRDPVPQTPSFERWPPDLSETVATCNSNKKSIIHLKTNDQETKCLLDTGSAITLVSEKWAKRLELPIKKATVNAKSINNRPLQILGTADVTFKVADQTVKHRTCVLRDSPFHIVLGVDILKKLGKSHSILLRETLN